MSAAAILLGTLVAVGWVASWLLTGLFRRYALAKDLLDHPNERSSHTRPTPRGGGMAFVVTFLVLAAIAGSLGVIDRRLMVAVLVSGSGVALLGFIDDRKPLPARVRFVGHSLAAIWVLACMGGIPPVPILGAAVDLGVAGLAVAAAYVVWSINLFNFMDGIDGIASVETISVALGGAWLWWSFGSGNDWLAAVLFAGCVAGFLVWNVPPARIFMGDAGSGFIGLVIALLSLWCGRDKPELFWSWFILIGCFMVDATTTLVRRVRRGERFFDAHRAHAYQYASRRFGAHLPVTLGYAAINVLWLLPMAWLVASDRIDGVVGTTLAYAPLVVLAFRFKAGDRASQEV